MYHKVTLKINKKLSNNSILINFKNINNVLLISLVRCIKFKFIINDKPTRRLEWQALVSPPHLSPRARLGTPLIHQ